MYKTSKETRQPLSNSDLDEEKTLATDNADSKKEKNISQEVIMRLLKEIMQEHIDKNKSLYFLKKSEDNKLEHDSETKNYFLEKVYNEDPLNGKCSGLSLYYGIQKIIHKSDLFLENLEKISCSNGKLEYFSDVEMQELENFLGHILFIQHYNKFSKTNPYFRELIGDSTYHFELQSDFTFIADTLGVQLDIVKFSIASNEKQAIQEISKIEFDQFCLIRTISHIMCIVKDTENEGNFYFYDPNLYQEYSLKPEAIADIIKQGYLKKLDDYKLIINTFKERVSLDIKEDEIDYLMAEMKNMLQKVSKPHEENILLYPIIINQARTMMETLLSQKDYKRASRLRNFIKFSGLINSADIEFDEECIPKTLKRYMSKEDILKRKIAYEIKSEDCFRPIFLANMKRIFNKIDEEKSISLQHKYRL